MYKISVLEVTSGLGMGGAEKALITRLKFQPANFNSSVLNVRPEIDVVEFDERVPHHKIKRRKLLRFLEILKYLKINEFDVIVVRTPLDAIRFGIAKRILFLRKTRLIFEAHSNYVTKRAGLNFLLKSLLRLNRSSTDLIIAVSDNVKAGPLCSGHRNIHKVYLGAEIDTSKFEILKNDVPRLLFVGRLTPVKRPIWLLERLLNVSQKISLPPFCLTILGTGALERELATFIKERRMEKLVVLEGLQENPSKYYASSTHLMSCSTNEGLPLTFFEAKLFGLQIVTTPSGGGSEILDPEDTLLNSFSEEEFEAALIKIFSNPAPDIDKRREIQSKSQWMQAEESVKNYYALISSLFRNL